MPPPLFHSLVKRSSSSSLSSLRQRATTIRSLSILPRGRTPAATRRLRGPLLTSSLSNHLPASWQVTQHRSMMAPPFPLPWDGRIRRREEEELELYRRFSSLCSFLDVDLHLPEDSPFRKWLAEKSPVLQSAPSDPKKEVEVLVQWLKEAQNCLVELEKSKVSAFKRSDWWQTQSLDYNEARLALHYCSLRHLVTLLLTEPAIIIPRPPSPPQQADGSSNSSSPPPATSVSQMVLTLVEAWVDGNQDQRLKAYWPLNDSDQDGYLTQAEMDKAVHGNIKPLELSLRECFLTLPNLTRKQRKKFEKFMKYYTRDQEDYPNKLRCIFAWAKKSRDPPKEEDKRITYDEYLVTQKEVFGTMGKMSEECIKLFAKTRVGDHENTADNRETIRLGVIFYFLLAACDVYVSIM